jgi:hypothetical protein
MNWMTIRSRSVPQGRRVLLSISWAILLGPGAGAVVAQEKAPGATPAPAASSATAADTAKLPMAQLEALVAPIALYPDPLLAQTLVASTYPLEIIQLQQWMAKHPGIKDKALADSVAKQPWDPSIQSMAAVPEVVKRLADDIQWTTELGNAFLAQQNDVMDAVQVMRKKAVDKGALASNEQQKVDTQVVEKQTVIVVQPTNPEVVYVPVYTPTVVYGPPVYPYPPIYYPPPPPPGAYLVAFTVGVMWRSAYWGGSCCYAGWGHGGNTVIINNNNHFNQINHYGGGGNNNWQHNPQHRGGAPYPNQNVANKYGGGGQGQRPGGGGGAGAAGGRGPTAGTQPAGGAGGRGPTAGTQPAGGAGGRAPTASTQPAGGAGGRAPSASTQPAGGGGRQPPTANMQPSGGTRGDQIGGRDVPSSRGGQSGFSGGQGGYSGASARASSSRGASSMGGSRGGGGGGRGGGGGGRGGGGRR